MADTYKKVRTGERAGSATAVQLPNIPAKLVQIKALNDNAGNVYLGYSSAVTVANGSTDTTTGFQLDAGESTGWIPIDSLNELWMICDNAGDDITYMVLT